MGDEKGLGCCKEAALLGRGDGLFGFQEATPPDLDLDKDEVVTLAHDQVKLTGGASPLLREANVPG